MKKKKHDENETGLEDGSVLSRRSSLTAAEVQAVEFRRGMRGYNEREVDAFLDRITEEFERLTEENQRLSGGVSLEGGTEIADAARAAEEIRRKAREEAAAILAGAQAGGGGGSGGSESAHIGKFISSEKVFLESLADLIRGHAESVKSTVRETQEAQARAAEQAADELAEHARAPVVPAPASEPASAERYRELESDAASPTETVAESAWTATASPAAATSPGFEPPAAIEAQVPDTYVPESRMTEPAPSVVHDEVISIPPSPVDTPMQESQYAADTGETMSSVFVDVEEPPEESDQATLLSGDDSFVADPQESPGVGEGEERSLRELFWGED